MDVSFKVNTMEETIEKTEKRKTWLKIVRSEDSKQIVPYPECVQKELPKTPFRGCMRRRSLEDLGIKEISAKRHQKLLEKETKLYPNLIKAMKDPTNKFNGLVPRTQGSYTPQERTLGGFLEESHFIQDRDSDSPSPFKIMWDTLGENS